MRIICVWTGHPQVVLFVCIKVISAGEYGYSTGLNSLK